MKYPRIWIATYYPDRELFAAQDSKAPPAVLAFLALAQDWQVRWGVGGNESTPPDVLRKLADDPHNRVAMAVAWNPKTPADVVKRLARHKYWEVRLKIAERYDVPLEILKELVEDESKFVVEKARAGTGADEVTL